MKQFFSIFFFFLFLLIKENSNLYFFFTNKRIQNIFSSFSLTPSFHKHCQKRHTKRVLNYIIDEKQKKNLYIFKGKIDKKVSVLKSNDDDDDDDDDDDIIKNFVELLTQIYIELFFLLF
jgi:hypothetical protein